MALTRYEDIRLQPDIESASAAVGITATNSVIVCSDDWTLTIPSNPAHGSSGVMIQVNNSRPVDPTQPGRYANPVEMSLQSVNNNSVSAPAVDPDFEQNWIDFAVVGADRFVGSGNWRYIRLKAENDSVSGLPVTLSAFLHAYHFAPMV